jgi:hypothetical protein
MPVEWWSIMDSEHPLLPHSGLRPQALPKMDVYKAHHENLKVPSVLNLAVRCQYEFVSFISNTIFYYES